MMVSLYSITHYNIKLVVHVNFHNSIVYSIGLGNMYYM